MSEPMSVTTLLTSLRDIRLPADAPGGLIAELAAAIGLAGLAALAVVGVVRLLTRPSQPPDPEPPQAADPRVALLHILKTRAPERYAALCPSLYRPEGGPDLATLQSEVAALD